MNKFIYIVKGFITTLKLTDTVRFLIYLLLTSFFFFWHHRFLPCYYAVLVCFTNLWFVSIHVYMQLTALYTLFRSSSSCSSTKQQTAIV